jgi:hypothetical protein
MSQASETNSSTASPAPALAKRLHDRLAELGIDPSQASVNLLTATRVDVGLWWRWRAVRVLACPDALVLLADGPRPFVQRAAYSELTTSFYSHRSAELVLVPSPSFVMVRSLSLPPGPAWELLRIIAARCGSLNSGLAGHSGTSGMQGEIPGGLPGKIPGALETSFVQPHVNSSDKGLSHA